MAVKPYTVEKEIGGVKYVAQFNGLSAAQDAIDSCYISGSSNLSTAKLTKYLFENVIVEPKGLTSDDFECMEDLKAVTEFAQDVMQGNFRDKKDKGPDKAKD